MAFIGNTNTTQAFIPAVDFFSGNASTTAFTLSRPVASVAQVQAVISNVPQAPGTAFTVSGNTITFTSAPPSGTNNIYVYYTSPITQVIAPSQGTVQTIQLGNITNIASGNSSLTLQTGTTPTTALTIDTSQNVGIGTSSPSSYGKFAVIGKSYSSTGYALTTDGSNFTPSGVTNSIPNYGIGAPETSVVSVSGFESLRFYTNQAERMRIDSSGNLLVNTTSTAGNASTFKSTAGAGQQAVSFWNNATSSTRYFVTFGTEASYTERGFITWNGTTTALSNASDFRLKENIVNAPSALQKIAEIQIRSFDFKENGRHVEYGVIAQELIEVIPAAVFEGSDNEDGSINKAWSVGLEPIIPVLVKAVQEQQALITALTARITALENK
jgi:hypothetical protein